MPDIQVGDLVRVKQEYRVLQDADEQCWLVVEIATHVWLEAALCITGGRRKWIGMSVLEKI